MSSGFLSNPQPIRPPGANGGAFPLPIGTAPSTNGFNRDPLSTASNSVTALSSATASPKPSVLIRRLSLDTTVDIIRAMLSFSNDYTGIELLSPDGSEDTSHRSAIVSFSSPDGALEAQKNLDGRNNLNQDSKMIVEIINGGLRRPTIDMASNATPGSSVSSSRGSVRIPFQPYDSMGTSSAGGFFGAGAGASLAAASDLANSEPIGPTNQFQAFSTQSPIGVHRSRPANKELLEDDVVYPSDTRNMPMPYDSISNLTAAIRDARSTSSNPAAIPPPNQPSQASIAQRLASLSLNTADVFNDGVNGHVNSPMTGSRSASMSGATGNTLSNSMSNSINSSAYGSYATTPLSAHSMGMPSMEPNGMLPHFGNTAGGPGGYRAKLPPINLADQNPPCNTLYVGNLPAGAAEEELKAMFSRQRGYKRMCFRNKPNGPMCFVEFENITTATKALLDLYGRPLHNSVKGGIRLSFSKNPLGVRSQPNPNPLTQRNNVAHMTSPNAFGPSPTVVSPPPGLSSIHTNHGNGLGLSHPGSQQHNYFADHPASNAWANTPQHHASFNGNHNGLHSWSTSPYAAAAQSSMMGN
ncbi:hypothetical protein HMPREF1624_06839 [Sporothrix schenckii ATCC 58251]|uniref:RRM domain-containing protein n=1 Tax=Sporothrix schenckii (strain ATCC 58251 / de Perez 2211183) TaxID=1391915 RepID=U7PQ67_SPOS1|nr:hypothetical protein HMPREF1624_06839 [Sporothrix schenckii ATCC 58251]